MSEKPVVLKIENVKKRYMIKRFEEKPQNKKDKIKKSFKNFFSSNSGKEPFYALNGVSINIEQGEKVGIIGKNGAGKSTLLKVISRITEPSDGRIEMLGKVSSMLEVGTGFNAELTGRENVYLNGAILGMTKAEVDKKFDEILEFSEVGKFIDTPVKRYSSGMFVRLAFSVAANLESDILLVDEVLAVGDTRFQKKCIDKMLDIARSGRTILFVSHQMNTIRQLCDRVIVLKKGKVIFDGDVEEGIKIYNEENLIEQKLHYEFENFKRPEKYHFDKAVINSLDILEKNDCIYEITESIKFKINVSIKTESISDISFRILFWKEDNIPVSSFFSKTFILNKDKSDYDFEINIKHHNLAPGPYKAVVVLTSGLSSNHKGNLDYIEPAFHFDVVREKGTSKAWSKEWGNNCSYDIELKTL